MVGIQFHAYYYVSIALIFAKYTIAYKLVKVNVTLGDLYFTPIPTLDDVCR